jgi:hypothetical protein
VQSISVVIFTLERVNSKDTYPVSLVQGFVWHLVGVLQMALLCTHSHKEIARKLGLENADVEY